MSRVLFLPMGDRAVASSRYRVYQYVERAGDYDVQARLLNWPSSSAGKSARLRASARTLLGAARADTVFVQKRYDEATRWATRLAQRVVFDFDDAIWLQPPNDRRDPARLPRLLRNLRAILAASDLVIAGNEFLADYARQFNRRVEIVPTVVDLEQYTLAPMPARAIVTIGWVGSQATVSYLHILDDALAELARRYPGRARLKVICDSRFEHPTFPVENVAWSLSGEVDQLRDIDIGIMPLRDTDWERGKCGFKLLQYMALGIAAVGAPVGVNTTILQQEVNGLLADSTDDWIAALSRLIDDVDLRCRLGTAGRRTVEQSYALQNTQTRFFALLKQP